MQIQVKNIKCDGCTSIITKKLNNQFNTNAIKVGVENSLIDINITAKQKPQLIALLLSIGYPETDSVAGLSSTKAKAKSLSLMQLAK